MLDVAYFDGRTAARHPARLEIAEGWAIVSWADTVRRELLSDVMVSESIAGAPRTLTFRDGAFCDVADDAALSALLTQAGFRDPSVVRWQSSWRTAGLSVALIALFAIVGYLYGLPALADHAAKRIPPAVARQLAVRTLDLLDSHFLDETKLSKPRRVELLAGFNALHHPADAPDEDVTLYFRSSPRLGPNAFTLPDGTIVMLDELVNLADNEEQIYAVLGHELGHAHFRHPMRITLQAAVVGTVMFAWVGDVNWLLATVPAAALQARYSREYEGEADLYSARLLKANGIPASRLAEMLEKLQARLDAKRTGQPEAKSTDEESALGNFLASHPSTPARIATLREMDR